MVEEIICAGTDAESDTLLDLEVLGHAQVHVSVTEAEEGITLLAAETSWSGERSVAKAGSIDGGFAAVGGGFR